MIRLKIGAYVGIPLAGSVRARILSLGLIAAIPAVGMAGIIAGQDYQDRERVAFDHVQRLQSLAVARIDVAVGSLNAVLVAGSASIITQSGVAQSGDCTDQAVDLLRHVSPLAQAVGLFDTNGALICYAGADSKLQSTNIQAVDWFEHARSERGPVLADLGSTGSAMVATAISGGVVVAVLAQDWFDRIGVSDPLNDSALWVFDRDHNLVVSSGLTAAALPSASVMYHLQTIDGSRLAPSAGGVAFAYTSSSMANGWRVIGAYRSTREHREALTILYTRLVALGALLLLGLGITVLGADIAFGGPLRRLRAALANWQAGAPFDGSKIAFAPTELVDMVESFTDATISLRGQKEELERAKTRQDLLMLEIHHRVKNNLQIVASLLNLQASRIRVPEARAEFQSARDRVRALATLHRHLYSEGEIHTVNMPSFLNELSEQLLQAMGGEKDGRIKLVIEAQEIRLSTDQAVPLALIVTEAVTNAIKYGFPGGRSGAVSIHLTQDAGLLDLVIADDGIGIPPGRAETESGKRDGIGLQLIRGFSRQLGATLEVTQQRGEVTQQRGDVTQQPGDVTEQLGTRYHISMPMRVRTSDGDDPGPGPGPSGQAGKAAS